MWVQPVTVIYREGGEVPGAFYGWWGDMGFESHIWDVVTRSYGGQVDVIFHPAVTASGFDDRKQLADHCQKIVDRGHAEGSPVALPSGVSSPGGSGEDNGQGRQPA